MVFYSGLVTRSGGLRPPQQADIQSLHVQRKTAFFTFFHLFTLSLFNANIVQPPSTKTLILEIRILKTAPFHPSSQPEKHRN